MISDMRQSVLTFWLPTLVAAAVIIASIQLARWQLDRAAYKTELLESWVEAEPVKITGSLNEIADHAPIHMIGQFDPLRQIMLDNQVLDTRVGVRVFTPFEIESTSEIVLVNRGWLPFDRRQPEQTRWDTPDQLQTLTGRISPPPRVGLQIGSIEPLDPDDWPNLMTYFEIEPIRQVLGAEIVDRVILLDPDHPAHLDGRPWQPVVMGPDRHRAYAFQWFMIALAVFLIWLVLSWRFWRSR